MKTLSSFKTNSLLTSSLAFVSAISPMATLPLFAQNNNENLRVRDSKPNFIYILADDAGYGDFSCYGQQKFETPGIDRLAEEGIQFMQHYAGAPVCAPSRCSLMTGLHTGHSYIRGNKEIIPEGQEPLPADTVTLPKLLQEAGYATGACGKWGLGLPGSVGAPENQGFDYFYGYNCQRAAHEYYPDHLWENEKKILLNRKSYSHDLMADKALQFIKDHADEPFFLFVPFTIPHAKLQVPDQGSYSKKPWGPLKKNFAAMMERMDEDVNDIINLVDELGLGEETIIFFSSDNGPHREGGADPHFFNSSGGFRGIKRETYEGGIRVPLVARWKGHIAPGQKTDFISAFWDMLPTLTELAGAKTPTQIDGISMVPTLLGVGEQKQHDYLYWEFHELGGKQGIRKGDWKGIRNKAHSNPNGPIELYNLKEDPKERFNVAKSHPEIAEELKNLMHEAHEPNELFNKLDGEYK